MSVQFDISLHNDFVVGHGSVLTYYKASLCPCAIVPYQGDANRSLLTCLVCNGTGYVYSSPVNIIGLVTGIRNSKDLVDAGIASPGDLVLGMAPGANVYIGDYDLLRIPNLPIAFNGQINTRGSGSTDNVPFVLDKIFRVFSVNPATGQVFDYIQGVDFTVVGRVITWLSTSNVNTNLPTGTTYTINANVIYDWIAFISPMERQDGPSTNIGQRALLRKRDISFAVNII